MGEPSRWRRPRDPSSLVLQSQLHEAGVELPGCVRLGPASQSLLEHSSCLFETLQSHQGLAQAEEAPGPAGPQSEGYLGISQGTHWLTQPFMAE